jgi:uncharacterized integral membrane protein
MSGAKAKTSFPTILAVLVSAVVVGALLMWVPRSGTLSETATIPQPSSQNAAH